MTQLTPTSRRPFRNALLILLAGLSAGASPSGADVANEVAVDLAGKVVDGSGAGVPGATVRILETALTATTGSGGEFEIKGSFQSGIVRRAGTPGGGTLEYRHGRVHLTVRGPGPVEALLVGPDGRSRRFTWSPPAGAGKTVFDVDARLSAMSPSAGTWLLRLSSGGDSRTFRLVRRGVGEATLVFPGTGYRTAAAAARVADPSRKVAADSSSLILEVSASGFHPRRRHLAQANQAGIDITLLPITASLKERIQDFVGAGNTFRLAFLKKENASSRKHVLHYVDFAEMAGDTMPLHAFADSKGPETTPFGANVPAWSPDGRTLAYEIGAENLTTPASRIHLQPLQGPRQDGPGHPATNPRFWTDGKDTALVWCTSGLQDGWKDSSSSTLRQPFVGGALSGAAEALSKGSYNGGLSRDGRYLATAFRHGVMKDREAGAHRFFHVYPGHPPAQDGGPTDSLQSCNASVSPDAARPSRMLFLDFGVPPGDTPYPNPVRPQHYAQHRMILIGDYLSEGPGRVVDFIDTPAEELAEDKTWDDPEWSNHPEFAVATTRDPDGDLTNPGEPPPTQPDLYLIHLPTRSALKVVSGDHMILPALWVGPKP
jgi:hypothetical protein